MNRSIARLGGIASVISRGFRSTASAAMPIKVGDKLPSIQVMEGTPGDKVNVASLFAGKKGVLFAVPGAFTPGCSKTHLPGYVEDFEKFKVHVFEVYFLTYYQAIDLELDATPFLGNVRSKRYSMLIEDGVIKQLNVEPDGTGLSCSLSNNLFTQI
ncbi:peroxiredoxin-5, mitochondrial-like [Orbicella faveolata]|uniref:peroxiredoxin-5, mitochondrial-like n=1 Tax=Orbicella faveolata TaxID=48498 RepID=UPI0009E1AB89|nr:peroxiredoxin-5, mitochondrial-like [Orbicella faveolata]